ncbi:MAG TPA: phosphoribosyltransferase family protein [bacterium]|nr:phosphoribosyltransferase family protein [bacterium]
MPAQADRAISLSWDGLMALCRHLALRVRSTYDPDVVVGIARVGILPATLIALLLRRDVHSLRVPVPHLPATLPSHLPSPEVIEGRRVLLVDEVAPGGQTLQRAAEALLHIGAREVRTLVLFSTPHGARADYSGPQATVMVLQPWIREVAIVDAAVRNGGGGADARSDPRPILG